MAVMQANPVGQLGPLVSSRMMFTFAFMIGMAGVAGSKPLHWLTLVPTAFVWPCFFCSLPRLPRMCCVLILLCQPCFMKE